MDDQTREKMEQEEAARERERQEAEARERERSGSLTPEDDDDLEVDFETDDEVGLGTPVASILDRAVAERDDRLRNQTIKFDIPTWDGALLAEYRLLGRKTVEEMQRRAARDRKTEMDMIARACVGIYVRDPDDGTIKPLGENGNHVRYTKELLAKLGKEDKLANKNPEDHHYVVIRHIFAGNDVALGAHAFRLMSWMADPTDPGDSLGDDLGEY